MTTVPAPPGLSRVGFTSLSAFELATGWVGGRASVTWPDLPGAGGRTPGAHPRRVLDDLLRPALQSGRCYVLFSGGRDSSAVLGAATALARRDGLALPIPFTYRHADDPAAEESRWQETVISHLGLPDWLRVEVTDELDILGPHARAGLQRYGVVYPPTAHGQAFLYAALGPASGCYVLTGEGGDEVLGPQRVAAVTALAHRIHHGRPPSRALVIEAARALAPRPVRRRRAVRDLDADPGYRWLLPRARRRFVVERAADLAGVPLDWRAATRARLERRSLRVGLASLGAVARESGVRLVHPLLEPAFVAALAAWGGPVGTRGRTHTMRLLFGDVLPDDVLRRTSKASFNAAATHAHARAFARQWDGTGVTDGPLRGLVDSVALRDEWLCDMPHAGSLALLHHAWLAACGHSV